MEPLVAHAIATCPEPDMATAVHARLTVADGVHDVPNVLEYQRGPPVTHATAYCPFADIAIEVHAAG